MEVSLCSTLAKLAGFEAGIPDDAQLASDALQPAHGGGWWDPESAGNQSEKLKTCKFALRSACSFAQSLCERKESDVTLFLERTERKKEEHSHSHKSAEQLSRETANHCRLR